jgi:DNA-binding transcriptional MerR regulator
MDRRDGRSYSVKMSPTTTTHYPIRVVSRMTGLSVDTLRAWERRYQAVSPRRGERGRAYSDEHVTRLKQLAGLVERGHAIGSIAGLSDAALRTLAQPSAGEPASHVADDQQIDVSELLVAIKRYDLAGMEAIVNRHAVMLPPETLVFAVVLPVLREMGERWQAGTVRPAQEHLVSAVMRTVLGGLLRTLSRPGAKTQLVFATLAGERHELGLLCAAVLAASAGHGVLYLGPDLPTADIAHAVRTSKATTLVLAGTSAVKVSAGDLAPLRRLPDTVNILVGGARSTTIRDALGNRARHVASIRDLSSVLERHAA